MEWGNWKPQFSVRLNLERVKLPPPIVVAWVQRHEGLAVGLAPSTQTQFIQWVYLGLYTPTHNNYTHPSRSKCRLTTLLKEHSKKNLLFCYPSPASLFRQRLCLPHKEKKEYEWGNRVTCVSRRWGGEAISNDCTSVVFFTYCRSLLLLRTCYRWQWFQIP
jgi:hypothetical protein